MPAGHAGAGTPLDRYRDLLARMDAAARAVSSPGSDGPCGECRACCGPLSLLSLEAFALLESGVLDDRAPGTAACPLLDDGRCGAGDARPFACRTRGLPVRHLDGAGDWCTEACGLAGGDGLGQDPVVPLAEWAAQLFHLDREFRGGSGLRPWRIGLVELCRAPGRYRALLAVPAGLPVASRVAT